MDSWKKGLKSGKIGKVGLDVYEEEALADIVQTIMDNFIEFERSGGCANAVTAERIVRP